MTADIFGNEVHVGDTIAYIVPGYSQLKTAEVARITRCGVTTTEGCNRRSKQIVLKVKKGVTNDC